MPFRSKACLVSYRMGTGSSGVGDGKRHPEKIRRPFCFTAAGACRRFTPLFLTIPQGGHEDRVAARPSAWIAQVHAV
jgi:hypothetical protein